MQSRIAYRYEVEIFCPDCHGRYQEATNMAGYHYRRCRLCGSYFAKRAWLSQVKEIDCTGGCGRKITNQEAKQFDGQCEDCWDELQQERSLNEEPLEVER